MNHKVKGVILAAGYGTRFLPASKTVPKELFPIIDTPAIDYVLNELISSGIKDILVITSRRKKALEDYLDREIELELALQGKPDKLNCVKTPEANITFIRQRFMGGTADALGLCESYAGEDPILVAYPDDIFVGGRPLAKQLIEVFLDSGKSVLAVQNMPNEDVSRYGVVSPSGQAGDNVHKINGIVEKPPQGLEPSHMVSLGRYLFTPEIFKVIRELREKPRKGEFYQTEVINVLARLDRVLALDFEGARFDTGEPMGYLKTIVEFALRDNRINAGFLDFLRDKVATAQKKVATVQ